MFRPTRVASFAVTIRLLVLPLTILLAFGCSRTPPPPYLPPAAKIDVEQFSGSALSGPTTRAVNPADFTSMFVASVKLVALEQPPPVEAMSPLRPQQVRLIASSMGGVPVLATARLTRDVRLASGAEAKHVVSRLNANAFGRSAPMGSFELAVPAGSTAVVRAADERRSSDGSPRGAKVFMYRPTTTTTTTMGVQAPAELELALSVEDQMPAADGSGPADAGVAQYTRELVVLRAVPVTEPADLALAVPFQYADRRNRAVLVLIHVEPGSADSASARKALELADAALGRSVAEAATRPTTQAVIPDDWPGYTAALAGLSDPSSRRASLAYLSSHTGAAICEDATLVADDAGLESFSRELNAQVAGTQPPRTTDALAWALDAAALRSAAKLQSEGKLPAELLAVLIRHAGQAAQNAAGVAEMLAGSKDRRDFESRLVAENLVYLEDSSPAARVRAFDWLRSRGQAPPGFDPLAPPRERRAALERAFEAMAAKSSQSAQPVSPAGNGGKP